MQVTGYIPALQQCELRDANYDDDDEGPQYAELAPSTSRRTTGDRARVVNNSTALYADIVHFYRPPQQP